MLTLTNHFYITASSFYYADQITRWFIRSERGYWDFYQMDCCKTRQTVRYETAFDYSFRYTMLRSLRQVKIRSLHLLEGRTGVGQEKSKLIEY